MTSLKRVRSVLITGAGGNLGQKLITHLLARDWSVPFTETEHAFGSLEDAQRWLDGAEIQDSSDQSRA
ncbi:hypothetical protein JKG68_25910 [Microvirga aerilata]|uniref:Uncharacterized protein n=1 Tax=Microvirga aerilata TaxID=670292 RepID=A0A936ZHW5_9HYPH|nr:hypothetical protein [Microvirga aerilata]MBL0407359.1 hypothetical protein [Microvirga aerilata]